MTDNLFKGLKKTNKIPTKFPFWQKPDSFVREKVAIALPQKRQIVEKVQIVKPAKPLELKKPRVKKAQSSSYVTELSPINLSKKRSYLVVDGLNRDRSELTHHQTD